MNALTVLYDARCEFCCAARDWVESQEALVPITLLPAGSEDARERFPELDHDAIAGQLVAIGDSGEVFRDDKAWLVTLWATRRYRHWSSRLSAPGIHTLTKQMTTWIGRHRTSLGPFGRMLIG